MSSADIPPIKIITDPERIKIMLNDTRMKILRVMREGIRREGKMEYEFTVAELAEMLDIKVHNLYHHIDKLTDHDFLEKSREIKKKRSIIAFYRRTARGFIINYEDEDIELITEKNREFIDSVVKIFGLQFSEDQLEKLLSLFRQLQIKEGRVIEELNSRMVDPSDAEGHIYFYLRFIQIIKLTNDPEALELYKQIGEVIFPELDKFVRTD